MVEFGLYAAAAELCGKCEAHLAGLLAHRRHIYLNVAWLWYLRSRKLCYEQQPFHSHSEAYAGKLRSAKLLQKPVIAASAAYRS